MKKQNLFIFIFLMYAAPMRALIWEGQRPGIDIDSEQGGNKTLYCKDGKQIINIKSCEADDNYRWCAHYGGISICS